MTLSQDQINALLEGTGTFDDEGQSEDTLDPKSQLFFMDFSRIAMAAGSVAISQALGKTVNVVEPEVSMVYFNELEEELSSEQVLIRTGYQFPQLRESVLLIKDYDVAVIFDILMGKDGRNPDLEIGELQISAIGEVMNQLIGAAATALSQEYGQTMAMKAPESQQIQLNDHSVIPAHLLNGPLVQMKYNLLIDGILDSEIYELRTLSGANSLFTQLTSPLPSDPVASASASPVSASETHHYATPSAQTFPPVPSPHSSSVNIAQTSLSAPLPLIRQAEFSPLTGAALPATQMSPHNFERVVDIPLKVTVELGSKKIKIKDILDLNKGSVVELSRVAGEPVDMFVNGKIIAKGEVVVVNENFGLRITEILGPNDRMKNLGSA